MIPLITITMFIIWSIFIMFFYKFYNDAIQLVETEHSKVIQFLVMFQYREKEILTISLISFILIFIHLFFIHYEYYMIKNALDKNRWGYINLIISILTLIIPITILMMTPMYLVFIPISIIALVIVYLAYLIAKIRYGTFINIKENIIGIHGPFKDKNAVEVFISELITTYNEVDRIDKRIYQENDKYFVEYIEK